MPRKKPAALGAEQALTIITDQWFVLVVHALMKGEKKRYSELAREIPRISRKMLTQTLRGMERDGMLHRYVKPVVPPHTEYELSELGMSLVPPLRELCHWAGKHYEEVEELRTKFDQQAAIGKRGDTN